MQKIVINRCYGGFGLSHKAIMRYAELKGLDLHSYECNYGTKTIKEVKKITKRQDGHLCYTTQPVSTYEELNEFDFYPEGYERNDPILIQIVEELGHEANDRSARLEIIEIPDDVKWEIKEYDGIEWVAEAHRTWQ